MNNSQHIIEILKRGGVAIFPTDTVMGIGCRIDDKKAVEKVFGIKKRSPQQAVPILVSSIAMAREYVTSIQKDVEGKLMEKYWPGGLTIILPAEKTKVSSLLRGGGENIGLRIPAYKMVQELIEAVGVPIIGTSANFHGEKTPITQVDLNPDLVSLVDGLLEGDSLGQVSSTIIDVTVAPWKVLRMGAIEISL